MKAAVYDRNGGPEVLRYEDVPDPVCPADGVIIRHEAIAIEGGDLINRASSIPPHPGFCNGLRLVNPFASSARRELASVRDRRKAVA
jgi:NADPH:quinone reductase-like Zn-dependent oxidoreductase